MLKKVLFATALAPEQLVLLGINGMRQDTRIMSLLNTKANNNDRPLEISLILDDGGMPE